jgi:hypothetical protein
MRSLACSLVVSMMVLAGCERGDLDRGARTTVTSGEAQPSPAPASRTVDNAGNTTETTNAGVPVVASTGDGGAAPSAPDAPATKAPRAAPGAPPADFADAPARIARALCDHESACTRVGPQRTWESDGACMSAMRVRTASELEGAQCRVDATALAVCLGDVRKAACNAPLDRLGAVASCQDQALCVK